MKVSVASKKDNHLEVTMTGEDHSFSNLLRETLSENDDVEFVAYNIDHPQLGHPKLQLVTKGKKPQKALSEAIKKIRKEISEFQSALDKVKETKSEKTHREHKEHKEKKKK